ncbi:spermidine/putrescine ABC transporter permease [Cypionkella aquatica]|uniref:Spermidine/putrescine ABC transporter permease n=1 Tax=Cypionkella aquatica TaxID=1756042 RepID=A0AA37TSL4_9RHOB|nr:ABC transporter permease [Cypionkella aquatica]GLS85141.1 spermidine/putrescine ABC transporter permease [Cypionkella aquatica]GLS86713.1 spermidine/putrescine ABC transporter permease [Cypionkella aquatica]
MQSKPKVRFWGSEAANGLLMISPTAIYAILLLAAPLAMIFAYSFMTDGYLKIIPEFQLCNYFGECHSYKDVNGARSVAQTYRGVWSDPLALTLLWRSLVISLVVTATTVLLAFPVAYFVSFYVAPSKKSLWLFLITIPFWTSYLIRVFLWKVILGTGGVINSGLLEIGLISEPITWLLYNANSVVITLAHAYAPFAILPIFVSLEKIDRSFLEAGRDLGESPFMTFWRVTLPLAMPGVVSAVLIVFIPTIGDYVTPNLVGGPEGKMVANLIELNYKKLDNYTLGSALAISSMAIVMAVSLLFLFLNRRFLKGNKR